MHSLEYLLDKVRAKILATESSLQQCEQEVYNLAKNFDAVKYSVTKSVDRHIETLQCRAKWLNCHADSIYHLKHDSLQHQMSELQHTTSQLQTCLKTARDGDVDTNIFRDLIKHTLKTADDAPLLVTESGAMRFSCDDEKMEEMIISFGEVNIQPEIVNGTDKEAFDFLSDDDDDILIMTNGHKLRESVKETFHSIEMETKSIEIQHMTSESAASEEVKKLTLEDKQSWLLPVSAVETTSPVQPQVVPAEWSCFQRSIDSEDVVSTTDDDCKVVSHVDLERWLHNMSWEENTLPPQFNDLKDNDKFDCFGDWISCKKDAVSREKTAESVFRQPCIDNPLMENEINNRNLLNAEKKVKNALIGSDVIISNLQHFDNILKRHPSSYLLTPTLDESKIYIANKWKFEEGFEASQNVETLNLRHCDAILKRHRSTYLIKPTTDASKKLVVKSHENIRHMDTILKCSAESYLRQTKEDSIDHSLCDWLIGKSADRCIKCNELCEFEIDDIRWLKTATDW